MLLCDHWKFIAFFFKFNGSKVDVRQRNIKKCTTISKWLLNTFVNFPFLHHMDAMLQEAGSPAFWRPSSEPDNCCKNKVEYSRFDMAWQRHQKLQEKKKSVLSMARSLKLFNCRYQNNRQRICIFFGQC